MSTIKHGSLCTGYGGLDIAAQNIFGGTLSWWSDVDPGPIAVMQHHHPDIPNIGDLTLVDWATIPRVDILTAGYPCQPFSNAGKRQGIDDPRHIWPWIAGAIATIRPRIVVLENVAAHLGRGFDIVLADLAAVGYDAAWCVVRASDVGAPHRRDRLFVVAQDADQQPGPERWPAVAGETSWGGHGPTLEDEVFGLVLAADTAREHDDRPRPAGPVRRHEHPDRDRAAADRGRGIDWQQYEPAIRRWERTLGRPAPFPSVLGPRGGVKVSPLFGEWLMGLDEGRITSVPGLTINQQLKLVGGGVVPQQAELAIRACAAALSTEIAR